MKSSDGFRYQLKGPKCSRRDLLDFEEFIHAPIPDSYAAFLENYNGCVPAHENDTFENSIELPGGKLITVHQFYSLSFEALPLRCLYQELEMSVGILPLTSIPIGHDSFANVIGLDCETGFINWTLCEQRFRLDYLNTYELNIEFAKFLDSLKAGPYL